MHKPEAAGPRVATCAACGRDFLTRTASPLRGRRSPRFCSRACEGRSAPAGSRR